MKIALYIEDGLEQIVFTPESETEKGILGKLSDGSRELSIKKGGFYHCVGGWTRESGDRDSTMVVLRPIPPAEPSMMTASEAAKYASGGVIWVDKDELLGGLAQGQQS